MLQLASQHSYRKMPIRSEELYRGGRTAADLVYVTDDDDLFRFLFNCIFRRLLLVRLDRLKASKKTRRALLEQDFTGRMIILSPNDQQEQGSERVFRLDALALSVIATATWLAGWVAGWLSGWLSHSGIV